jgi:predicted nucleotidyltransferase
MNFILLKSHKILNFFIYYGGNAEIFDYFCNRLRTMNMRRTEVVNQISKAIRKVAPTATAILYGSEARGDARSDSDIDVLILLDGDKMSLKREMEVTGPLNEIEWQTGVLVSPTVMLRKQWENMPFKTPFYINVMNEGIRI